MRQEGGLGGCLFQVLIILVVLAIIGIVDWSTVSDWVIFMLIIPLLGIGLVVLATIYGWLTNENQDK